MDLIDGIFSWSVDFGVWKEWKMEYHPVFKDIFAPFDEKLKLFVVSFGLVMVEIADFENWDVILRLSSFLGKYLTRTSLSSLSYVLKTFLIL